jgi:hypothetical protein
LLEPLFGGAEDGCRNDGRQSLNPILGALLGELLHQESREFPVLADPEALGSTEIAVADACDANRFVPETHGAEHGGLVLVEPIESLVSNHLLEPVSKEHLRDPSEPSRDRFVARKPVDQVCCLRLEETTRQRDPDVVPPAGAGSTPEGQARGTRRVDRGVGAGQGSRGVLGISWLEETVVEIHVGEEPCRGADTPVVGRVLL